MEKSAPRISIRVIVEGRGEARGELIRFLAPRTVERMVDELPIEGRGTLWKEEVYFEKPLRIGLEKGVMVVEAGTLAYWPMGNAVCIFFGRTQPYSPVNRVGMITENLELFKNLKSGTKIRIERA